MLFKINDILQLFLAFIISDLVSVSLFSNFLGQYFTSFEFILHFKSTS